MVESNQIQSSHYEGLAAPEPLGLWALLRTLLRWSWVVAPLVTLTIWLALSQTESIQPEYTASSALLLVGPTEVLVEDFETGEVRIEDVNPLQSLGGNLPTVARILVLAMSDVRVSEQLAQEGWTGSSNVWNETRTPIIRIEVLDEDPAIAVGTADRMADLLATELAQRQDDAGAPESDRLQIQSITSASSSDPDFGARDRVRLAIAAVGLAISAATAFFLEGIYQLWSRRKSRRETASEAAVRRGLPSGVDDNGVHETAAAFRSSNALIKSEHNTLVGVVQLIVGDATLAEDIANDTNDELAAEWEYLEPGQTMSWYYRRGIEFAQDQDAVGDVDYADDPLWATVLGLPLETRTVLALGSVAEMKPASITSVTGLSAAVIADHQAAGAEALAVLPGETRREREMLHRPSTTDSSGSLNGAESSQRRSGTTTTLRPRSKRST